MKRVMAGLAFALTLIRMLTAAASAQEYQTVSQLRESVMKFLKREDSMGRPTASSLMVRVSLVPPGNVSF